MKKQEMDNQTEQERNVMGTIINVMIILLTLVIVVLAVMLGKTFLSYLESRKEYDELREMAVILQEESSETPESNETGTGEQKEEDSKAEEVQEPKEPECKLEIDFASLKELNPDIKGWIYMEALDMSYPVVQGADNDEYLYTSVKGTENRGGSIFMDAWNSGDFKDPHTLIYGHNMKDDSMFGRLKDLYNQKFVDELDSPLCFWIITPDGKYRYDVFSIHTVDASGDTYTIFSNQGDEVGEYLNKMARYTGVKLPQRVYNAQDRAVTLSTCTGNDQYRLVVQGVLHVE